MGKEKCSNCGNELRKEQTFWPKETLKSTKEIVGGVCKNCTDEDFIPFPELPPEIKDIVSIGWKTNSNQEEVQFFGVLKNI